MSPIKYIRMISHDPQLKELVNAAAWGGAVAVANSQLLYAEDVDGPGHAPYK